MNASTPTLPPEIEPMTWSLMGRFFGVPLLIIGTIVAGAVVVVLLFGGPSAPDHQSLDSLLQTLEANSGERSAGVLLPREKELWQTALELSERLQKKEVELTPEEVTLVADRLAAMVEADLEHVDRVTAFDEDLARTQREIRSTRFDFLLRALARTEQPIAVETLIHVVRSGQEPYVAVAIQQLGELHAMPESREAIEPILEAMKKSSRPETLLTATTVLSVLAPKGDARSIEALTHVRLSQEGEVEWSAALALARLGSSAGKATLLDLLDRKYLESGELYQVKDESGAVKRYPLPRHRVDALLEAAMDAAANLDDAGLWASIDRLKSDPSPGVKGKAIELAKLRPSGVGSSANG